MEENTSLLKKATKYIVTVILLAAIAAAGFFYYKYQQASQNNSSSAQVTQVVNEVSKLMVLPSETPTLATVNDPTQLTSQQFFQNAKIGDKVLIYLNAKIAILYRPSINKIINVAPVNTVGTSTTPTPSASQTGTPNVAIYNGTSTSNLASKVETELEGKISNLSFTQAANASKKNIYKNFSCRYIRPIRDSGKSDCCRSWRFCWLTSIR